MASKRSRSSFGFKKAFSLSRRPRSSNASRISRFERTPSPFTSMSSKSLLKLLAKASRGLPASCLLLFLTASTTLPVTRRFVSRFFSVSLSSSRRRRDFSSSESSLRRRDVARLRDFSSSESSLRRRDEARLRDFSSSESSLRRRDEVRRRDFSSSESSLRRRDEARRRDFSSSLSS